MKELYEWSECQFTYLSHAWPNYTGCFSETHQASCYKTCCMMNSCLWRRMGVKGMRGEEREGREGRIEEEGGREGEKD